MKEEYVFWFLAKHFVKEENYRIFHFSKEQNELWLENPDNKQAPILRLLNCELDWSSWIERDIQLTEFNGEKIRKQQYRKKVEIINLYISPYPPVDDYEYRISQHPVHSHIKVQSIILAGAIFKEELSKLQSNFKKDINVAFINDDHLYNESIEQMKKDTFHISTLRVKKEQAIFNYGKPLFTYLFIAFQVIVFILLELNGG
ncbi:MAG TPA: rhomboid family intramembrane serine protease, partial [Pseudoneobacillus sp.]|nr:rhomboid family intramembrane serine protease [Pseudoneobacillus sp.]